MYFCQTFLCVQVQEQNERKTEVTRIIENTGHVRPLPVISTVTLLVCLYMSGHSGE